MQSINEDKAIDSQEKPSALSKMKDGILPGFIVASAIGFISMQLGKLVPDIGSAPIAIFSGMFIGNMVLNQKVFQKGYKFSESNLLSYSIVLLGATLSISSLQAIGFSGVLYIALQMTVTIAAALFIGKKLGFGENFRFLMASGNAVCGSSAVAATAPVVDANEQDKGIAITLVNVIGIVLMFTLPVLTEFLYNHSELQTSAMIGGTLQSVGQVVASGGMVNEGVKDLSTVFKIVRVIFLVVVVIAFGYMKSKPEGVEGEVATKKKVSVPWYIIGFFIMCALFSMGIISQDLSDTMKDISKNIEIIALAAIGLRVNLRELIKQGKVMTIYGLSIGVVQVISSMILISLFL